MSRTPMWRRGALGAVTAVALVAATLSVSPAAIAATSTTNVHGGDITGWDTSAAIVPPMPSGWFKQSDNQGGTATGTVVADDTEPVLHDGSLHLATPTNTDKVAVQHNAGSALLSSFVTGSYAAKVITGPARATYQLVIDCNGAAPTGFATLNYSGELGGAQSAADGWQTLDVVSGGSALWWSTRTLNGDGTTAAAGTAPTATPDNAGLLGGNGVGHTLSQIKATCSAGTVSTYGVDMGSGSGGLDGNVDSITFNDAVSNFQRVAVARISGLNRVETAVAASKELFSDAGTTYAASAVVLASSQGFADGVSGVPLAAWLGGPLLLTAGSSLDPATQTEIQRTLPHGGTVHLLGGIAAISEPVAETLRGLGFTVVRLAGANRYETAVEVAKSMPGASTVLLTSGLNFPDALSAGPAAAMVGGVVLLTAGETMATATSDYLAAHQSEVFAVGGAAAKAWPSTPADHQLVGADRYETGTKVAQRFFSQPNSVIFASGQNFPDALSGGAFAALSGSPILLVNSTVVPPVVQSYLHENEALVSGSAVVGGDLVVTEDVRTSLETTLNGF